MLFFFRKPRPTNARNTFFRKFAFEVIELETRVMPANFAPTFMRYDPPSGIMPFDGSSPSGLSPGQMRHAYSVDLAAFGSVVGNGAGQTIAIVDAYDQPNIASDLAAFDSYYGLQAPASFTQLNQDGGTSLPSADSAGGWGVETSLDVEWAHVIAPAASILLIEANSSADSDLYAAVDTARNHSGVSVVSMSWGGDESSGDSANNTHFTTPSGHNGVTFIASSGDNGAYSNTGSGTMIVQYPAASPNVVSVGGTTLTTGTTGSFVSETGWGGGTDSYNLGGSGGGISSYASQPSYQVGVVTQSTTHRTVPDVALDADPASGAPVYDTYDNGSTTPWAEYGGTSLAAPMWAGVIAIGNQGRAHYGLATLDGPTSTLPKLYTLPSSDFHDITSGNNGYAAGTGYDLVTGRGSPIVNLVASGLVGNTPTVGALTVDPTAVVTGGAVTLTASNVAESGGTASVTGVNFYRESNGSAGLQIGSDTLVGAGTQNGTTWTLANVSTTGLTAGTYTYYAVATDSNALTGAPDSAALTVTGTPMPIIGSLAASPMSVITGGAVTLTAFNVIESGGTASVTGVDFYRESNNSAGLQIGLDTLVGAGTQNGTSWTIANVSTAGLAVGSYTFYAVATDSSSLTSSPASATLTITNPGPVLAWSVTGQAFFGAQGLAATTVAAGVANSLSLTRGSGVSTSGNAPNNAWGGKNWASTFSAGISGNQFASFGLTVGAGNVLSLSAIDLNYRHNFSGPSSGYWQYQINGGSWNLIGNFANEFPSTASSGGSITEISLSGISGLQNLAAGAIVNIRVVPYGAISSSGGWYVYDKTGNDLIVNGRVTPALTATTTTISYHTPNPAAPTQNVTFNVAVSGTVPNGETVTLKDASNGNAIVGSGALSSGSAVITVAAGTLSAGAHSIFAVYAGDATRAASQSSTVPQTVLGTTITTITSNTPNPAAVSQNVTFNVSVSSGTTVPDGETVILEDASNGNALVGSGALSSGAAAITIPAGTLSAGAHNLFAAYPGDATLAGSQSTPVSQLILAPTTTTLIGNAPNPSIFGQDVSFTAAVSAASSINGETVFIEDASNANAVVASPTLTNGTVDFTLASLSVGTHDLFAVYNGDSMFAGSNSSLTPVTQVVNGAGPAPAVSAVSVNGGAPAYLDSNGLAVSLAGQNSVVEQILVTFNEPVTLDPGAFTITNDAAAVTVNAGPSPSTLAVIAAFAAVPGSGNTQFIVTFNGPGTTAIPNGTGNVIDDGVYILNTLGSHVHANGQTAADNNTGFWALYGSAAGDNLLTSASIGDGTSEVFVDNPDYSLLKNAFGSESDIPAGPPAYNPALDSDLNGYIDNLDYSKFKNNFGADWSF